MKLSEQIKEAALLLNEQGVATSTEVSASIHDIFDKAVKAEAKEELLQKAVSLLITSGPGNKLKKDQVKKIANHYLKRNGIRRSVIIFRHNPEEVYATSTVLMPDNAGRPEDLVKQMLWAT